jgi:hypothetical protein
MDNSAHEEIRIPTTPANSTADADRAPRGVLVLGMHRSGTSAVAGLTNLLGLATCVSNDLITGMAWNPSGHWESRSLTRLNDQLLAEMGHTWWYPPPSGALYSDAAARIAALPDDAGRCFDRVHPSEPWVWKDPRTCLTLPFWRQALRRSVVGIVVFRNPLDVATSLRDRNSLPLSFGVALWERYTRLLLEHAGGMPLLVSSYDDVLQDPVRWSDTARAFLTALGITVHRGVESDVCRRVDPRLRHSHHSRSEILTSAPATVEAFEALEGCVGAHRSFESPALAAEDPTVGAELRSRWPDLPPAWNAPPWSAEDGEVSP